MRSGDIIFFRTNSLLRNGIVISQIALRKSDDCNGDMVDTGAADLIAAVMLTPNIHEGLDIGGAAAIALKNKIAHAWQIYKESPWYHVAICIDGPLVIHAVKGSGVFLEVLTEAYKNNETFTVMRSPISEMQEFTEKLLQECAYWLGEKYDLKGLLRKGLCDLRRKNALVDEDMHPGQSICSFLVQKIFAKLGATEFMGKNQILFPIELYDLLHNSIGWQVHHNEPFDTAFCDDEYSIKLRLAICSLKKNTIEISAQAAATRIALIGALNKASEVAEGISNWTMIRHESLPSDETEGELEQAYKLISSLMNSIEPAEDAFVRYHHTVDIITQPKNEVAIDYRGGHWIGISERGRKIKTTIDLPNADNLAYARVIPPFLVGVWSRQF